MAEHLVEREHPLSQTGPGQFLVDVRYWFEWGAEIRASVFCYVESN